jgi:hypothetical protein
MFEGDVTPQLHVSTEPSTSYAPMRFEPKIDRGECG